MQKQATIIRWDTTRGFGFMRSTHTTADVFFNIRDWVAEGEQPSDGLQVFYEEIEIGGRAPRLAVRPVEYTARGRKGAASRAVGTATGSTRVARRLSNGMLAGAGLVVVMLLIALGWTILQTRP